MTRLQFHLVSAVGVLLLALAPALLSPFSITLLNFIGIYALAVLGLVLLSGIGGMLSFGQAAFVGIAAYATAWLTVKAGYSPWIGLVVGVVLTGLVAAILGAVTLRLGGHFLSLSTIAWGLATYFLFGNVPMLGQYNGISEIPPISIGGYALASSNSIYYLIWVFLIVSLVLSANLLDSREGRAVRALRGGQVMTESLGINPFRVKLITFVIAALLSALSGWLYAHMSRFVSPAPFDVSVGILYLLMAMVGGMAYLSGAIVGAAVVTLLKNSIQDWLPVISPGASGQLEVIVFSVLFILLLQRARAGIVPFALRWLPRVQPTPPIASGSLEHRQQPERGQPILNVAGATRRFGGLVAVDNVSFEVKAGEILGLIGPNGAGKTTMFNLITGALPLNQGKISFLGQDISRRAQRQIARAGIARTFQHVKLRKTMTLLDTVLLGHLRAHPFRLLRRGAAARPRRGSAGAGRGDAAIAACRPGRPRLRTGRQPAARQPAPARDRPRAGRRSRAADARRARRRPAFGRERPSSPTCSKRCGPRVSPSCWSSTTWISSWAWSTARW